MSSPAGFTTYPAGINNVVALSGAVFPSVVFYGPQQRLYMLDQGGKTMSDQGTCTTFVIEATAGFGYGSGSFGLIPLQVRLTPQQVSGSDEWGQGRACPTQDDPYILNEAPLLSYFS